MTFVISRYPFGSGYPSLMFASVVRCWIVISVFVIGFGAVGTAQDQPDDSARSTITRVVPIYPEIAHRLHLSGVVKLRVTVKPDGSPKSTEVLGGNPVLANAAQDAVKHWKWTPASTETKEIIQLTFAAK